MHSDLIESALTFMGCREIRSFATKVVSTCPNEQFHSSGRDTNPSFAVLFDDCDETSIPISNCFTCKLSEPFINTCIRFQFAHNAPMGFFILQLLNNLSVNSDDTIEHVFEMNIDSIREQSFDTPFTTTVKRGHNSSVRNSLITIDDIQYDVIDESVYAKYKKSVPRYALDRGLSKETCQSWELGHDKSKRRLLFPVRNHRQELVGISGRLYDDNLPCPYHKLRPIKDDRNIKRCPVCDWKLPPKYLHSKNISDKFGWRSHVLYGEHKIDHNCRIGILTEGNIDVLKLWQSGVTNPLASLGSNVSDIQIMKMRTWFDELWVWGDPDGAGRKMEEHVSAQFSSCGGVVRLLTIKPEKDPGDLTDMEIMSSLLKNDCISLIGGFRQSSSVSSSELYGKLE